MINYDYLEQLAIQRYQWQSYSNIDMELQWAEKMLFKKGAYCYFLDGGTPKLGIPKAAKYDAFNRPILWQVQKADSTTVEFIDGDEICIVADNPSRVGGIVLANDYWENLQLNRRAAASRRQKLSVPYIFAMNNEADGDRVTDILAGINSGAVFITDSIATLKHAEVMDLKVEPLLDKLADDEEHLLNNYMRELGYKTINRDKKERLLVNETKLNDDSQEVVLAYGIRTRENLKSWLENQGIDVTYECLPLTYREEIADESTMQD